MYTDCEKKDLIECIALTNNEKIVHLENKISCRVI